MQILSAEPRSAAKSAACVADVAGRAVLTELLLTPKPGLVDRRNCGAHRDMSFQTFLASARAIAHALRV
jgi:triphosphoribosyl-dephospho-CoA synthase